MTEAGQQGLLNELRRVRAMVERHATETEAALSPSEPPPALAHLCGAFELTPFERDVLLLCAAVELDGSTAALCARAQGDPARTSPTFSLALAALEDPHWSALVPAAPLRRYRLIELGANPSLVTAPLRIAEPVLHFLAGLGFDDDRIAGVTAPITPTALTPSQQGTAERIGAHLRRLGAAGGAELSGPDGDARLGLAAAACAPLGLAPRRLAASAVPVGAVEQDEFARLWERAAALGGTVPAIDVDAEEALPAAKRLLERLDCVAFVAAREPIGPCGRRLLSVYVDTPSTCEQYDLWQAALGDRVEGVLDDLAAQFRLDAAAIAAVADGAEAEAESSHGGLPELVWDTARVQTRPRLDDLAQRIQSGASWEDLVLPRLQTDMLREVAVHVRGRTKVYERWGFAARSPRGLGIAALFAGGSGTGKTMAAEVIARELRLDLYRIDLSAVVSKYIGETEKNLRRVFDAAEAGGAILLFDEADALFGKRSEVRDSHDRYANVEVSYLLQRMEAYRGLAVLTTNRKSALDPAFMRRLRFVVQFPFPDVAERVEIWRRAFPPATPRADLDYARLGQLDLTGGNVHNIALNAAFLAAEDDEPVAMGHVLRAARSEFAKLERPLVDAVLEGAA